jgi:LAO/AO transport system kinase
MIENFLKGDRLVAARVISMVENDLPEGREILDSLYGRVGGAHRIGITGPPGAGKSTIVDQVVLRLRKDGLHIGIIAADPSSPFTGGAFLGDRIRMADVATDDGVFIRSLATRGNSGGLPRTAEDICDVLDAFGKDAVVIETAGVGQTEFEIVHAADTTIVVLVPESGDSIQAMKAGLMEIGDIFCINKADREGADRAASVLRESLELKGEASWKPPVLLTIATEGAGIAELVDRVRDHRKYLAEHGLLESKRKARIESKIVTAVRERIWNRAYQRFEQDLPSKVERVYLTRITPTEAVEEIVEGLGAERS